MGEQDAHFYFERDLVDERPGPFSFGDVVVHTSRSPDKETRNEDAAAILPVDEKRAVLVVADGVGGHPEGGRAAALAIRTLRKSVEKELADDRALREAILSGFDRANAAVIERTPGGATTLAAAEIDDGSLRTYHVGDSAMLVFGGRGRIRHQTISHSPVGYAVQAGLLDEQDAMQHEDRHLISNCLGDPSMHVGMSSRIALRPRDTVLIASDGLFDNLHTEEIVQLMRRGPLEHSVRRVAALCIERMASGAEGRPSKPDDLTVIAFRRRVASGKPG